MAELQQEKAFQKRQIAYKTTISHILGGINVSRVNIIANVVYKSGQGLGRVDVVIDDGTGRILLRNFEKNDMFSRTDVGDIVLVIGRLREFNGEKYVMPEILKKLDNIDWMNVRKLELINVTFDSKLENRINAQNEESESSDINTKIFLLIKKLDSGDGVSVEELTQNSDNSKVEDIVNRLLENGDIFEVKPGKLKVLE